MTITIAIVSILILTAVFAALRKFRVIKICPICAGVTSTWLWILAGMYVGLLDAESWQLVAAIAMGGSVVGAAYRLEKHLAPHRSSLLWKTLFIPAGFAAAYFLLQFHMPAFIAGAVGIGIIALVFLHWGNGKSPATKELEEKLKQCC